MVGLWSGIGLEVGLRFGMEQVVVGLRCGMDPLRWVSRSGWGKVRVGKQHGRHIVFDPLTNRKQPRNKFNLMGHHHLGKNIGSTAFGTHNVTIKRRLYYLLKGRAVVQNRVVRSDSRSSRGRGSSSSRISRNESLGKNFSERICRKESLGKNLSERNVSGRISRKESLGKNLSERISRK